MHRAPTLVKILILIILQELFNGTFCRTMRTCNEMVQAVSRAIRASGCSNCRLSLLRAFTLIQSHPSQQACQPSIGWQYTTKKQTRPFSSFSRHATFSSGIAEEEGAALGDRGDDFESASSHSTAVPWYLQVQLPSKPLRTLSERQRIPDLPQSPPKILKPLLQQISVDLGLDDLSLLDLRHIDPPPALGANLLMIIGTARSEKHLHVSADRLCRWLRSEYKLRPDADGLLGRNELKLKLRRKNRRAKLLGSGTLNEDLDDGVRTGWVCVNVGIVESGTVPQRKQPQEEGFVGFGRRTEGVRIVVQMLVEEKREELNLEKLWNGIAKRSFAESEVMGKSPGAVDSQFDAVPNMSAASKLSGSTSIHSSATFPTTSIQSRGFHTATRKLLPALEQTSSRVPETTPIFPPHEQPRYMDLASIQMQTVSLLESGEYDAALQLALAHISSVTEFQNDGWRKYLLEWLKCHIEMTPREQALRNLGSSPKDHSSTPFLRCFYRTISSFSSESGWELQIWLHCFARELGHSSYTLERLSLLFDDLQLSGVTISDTMYLYFLRSALQPCGNSPEADRSQANSAQREFAVKILQDMYDRTGKVLTEDVFLALQESLTPYPTNRTKLLSQLLFNHNVLSKTQNLPIIEKQVPDVSYRMDKLMSTLQVRVLSDENRKRFMTLYARQYKWEQFWALWRSIAARETESRSPSLWALMFKLVAETRHQKGCMTVLRTYIPDMDREEPQVRLEGEVLDGVMACLEVADPGVNEKKLYDPEAKGEWINLYRRCLGIE